MRDPPPGPALTGVSPRDRALAWLATGPLGRLAAFLVDLGGALIGAARRRIKMWIHSSRV